MLEQIINDMKISMKEKNADRLSTLRMLKGAIDLERINKKKDVMTDEDIVLIISKQIKTCKESIIEFEKGNRTDLIDKTNAEISVLSEYMPEMLSEDEIEKIVDETINAIGASKISDMGKVMKELSGKLKGKADMSLVSNIIKSKLN